MHLPPSRGSSLIAIVVAVAILATVFLFFTSAFSTAFRAQTHGEIQSDLIDLRSYVFMNLSCPVTCSVGGSVQIDKLNAPATAEPLISGTAETPTKVGAYYLRSSCLSCDPGPGCSNGKKLRVEFLRGSSPTAPTTDPLTKRPYDWSDLFEGVPIGCALS